MYREGVSVGLRTYFLVTIVVPAINFNRLILLNI